VLLFLFNCEKEAIIVEQENLVETTLARETQSKTKTFKNENEKITYLKKGIKGRLKAYNKEHKSDNLFSTKYGKLDGKNAVTIKFPKEDYNFLVAIPFKNDNEEKLLICYYKNEKRTYKIVRNENYDNENVSKSEIAFLNNLELLFKLTTENNNEDNIMARSSDCSTVVLYYDYENCTTAYQDSCTGHIWIVSTLGKLEMCGGELDEVIIDGGGSGDGSGDDPDPEDDPTDWDPEEDEEPGGDEDCIEFDCEDGGSSGAGETDNDDTPVKIIDSLTGKAKCIYNKFEKSNSNLFKETIGAFFDDPKYNLILKNGNCSGSASACTDSRNISSTGEVIIIIDNLSGSIIENAALFLHEGIHAEIARYVQRHQVGEDPNDRARMFQLYKYYKELEVPEHHLDHPYMSLNYINPIANALRQLDGFKYPINYYMSFAWDGLRNWDVSNLLGMEEATKFAEYRTIVNANTNLTCDD